MAIRILTKNGIENTNIDGARDNNFNAGRRSGIVKGALNEGNLYGTSNTLTLEPCELRLCGHRVVIDENENMTFTNRPQTSTTQSLIAQIQVDGSDNVVFDLIVQNSSTALTQDNLDINGNGTYQLEIGTFTQNTDGTIDSVSRTAELIVGGDINHIWEIIYPVGAIYLTIDRKSPAEVFGGEWEQIAQGRTLFGAGTLNGITYTAGETVNAGLPNITGTFCGGDSDYRSGAFVSSVQNGSKVGSGTAEFRTFTFDASASNQIYGNSETVQPNALVVYMWKRVA